MAEPLTRIPTDRASVIATAVFVAMAVAMGVGATAFYRAQAAELKLRAQGELTVAARLKAEQVSLWREELSEHLLRLATDPLQVDQYGPFLAGSATSRTTGDIRGSLEQFRDLHRARGVFLTTAAGRARTGVTRGPETLTPGAPRLAARACREPGVLVNDLHQVAGRSAIRMELVACVFGADGRPIGMLVVQIDPYDYLYPLLRSWPTSSATAETVLARVEGRDVTVLSELRHLQVAPLTQRAGRTDPRDVSAALLDGRLGVQEGVDYRRTDVVAYLAAIPNSPWFIVAKVDQREIYSLIRVWAWGTVIATSLLILAGALAVLALLQRQRKVHYKARVADLAARQDERARADAERRQMEDQLRQAQKMEAVGQLAGGVAHDFNNLLTTIRGYADLLLESFAPSDTRRADTLEITRAAERASALTRQLMALGRKQHLQPKVFRVNDLLLRSRTMLERVLGEHVEVEMILAPGGWTVYADPDQITQVIMNLALNARDALPQGGRLRLTTTHVAIEGPPLHPAISLSPDDYVVVAVEDNGVGMAPEVLARVFEPFYTTKDRTRGSGLGLPTALGILQQSGGMMQMTSTEGVGTTVQMYLPRSRRPMDPADETPSAEQAPVRGRESILLVEDEPGVRHITKRQLEGLGYRVLEAAGGEEAITIADDASHVIDAMLSDVVMPHMVGPQVADAVRARRPDVKVMYMSGYAASELEQHRVSADVILLKKPFTVQGLARALRATLDGTPAE